MKNILILGSFLLFSCTGVSPELKEKQFYEAVNSVMMVAIIDNNGQMVGTCSSVNINYKGKNRLITANHCCEGLLFSNEDIHSIIKQKESADLCEISPSYSRAKKGISLHSGNVVTGDKIIAVGIVPTGIVGAVEFIISEGRITGMFNLEKIHQSRSATAYMSSSPTHSGMSGGGLIKDNKLLGITSMRINSNGHGIFITVDELKKFLDE